MRQTILTGKINKFWDRVEKTEHCWEWNGYINQRWGYGYAMIARKNWRVHRLAYTLIKGEIPNGMHLDHLCRNRVCVNPDHLEPVSNKENVLRGQGITAVNARKKQCLRGHKFNDKNTYLKKNGQRMCKSCREIAHRKYRAR